MIPRSKTHPTTAPLFAVAILAVAGCGGPEAPLPPNVVLISIDSLRPDHLACYGYRRNTSPNIDGFAREGALFEAHVSSAPWTLPAHAALFTSVPDSVHGLVDPIGLRLAERFETLPESFQSAGYRTAGFFAGPYLHPAFGFGQGFDTYEDCGRFTGDTALDEEGRWAVDQRLMRASHQGVTNDRVHARWSAFLERAVPDGRRTKPFFAFVHLWDVHYDFEPPSPFDTMFDPDYDGPITGRDFFWDPGINAMLPQRDREHIVALYDGEIRWTDTFIGRIRKDLEARGQLENTIVVITSGHGTELFDHGGKGHRTTLHDEQIMIPLIVWYPAHVRPGRYADVTRTIDVGPTLRDLVDLPAVATSHGRSLRPLMSGGSKQREPAVSELMSVGRNLRSIRTESDKLIHDSVADAFTWYDLILDPSEDAPRAVGGDSRSIALRERYGRIVAGLAEAIRSSGLQATETDVPEAIRRSLGGLGYLSDPYDSGGPDDSGGAVPPK